MSDPAIGPELSVADFDFELPSELIAQTPLSDRAGSRLLVLNRRSGEVTHSSIRDLGVWLRRGDLLVANNSRVLPGRLRAVKTGTGGRVELLLLRDLGGGGWMALAKPARSLRPGIGLTIRGRSGVAESDLGAEVVAVMEDGLVELRLDQVDVGLEDYGEPPLPPYIAGSIDDPERYQTVYASAVGSAAAPTAGLHFTTELIADLRGRGVGWAEVTLHVGLDTFRPVTVKRVAEHRVHREWCSVPEETARAVAETRAAGGRVVAVGTTTARTLETLGRCWNEEEPRGTTAMTDLFIVPGYRWRMVDALVTNFHLPRSTLLMMVSALAGTERIKRAYEEAIRHRYRFYSFGDAMLIM